MPKYGEMIVKKVVAIEKNRQKHRDADDKNQLAIRIIESQRTKTEEQIDISVRALIDDEARLANAGEKGGRPRQDEELLLQLGICAKKIKGKLTVKNVAQEWTKHPFEFDCPARNKLQRLINLHSNLSSEPTQ